jgi:hypothetical protein
MNTQTGWVKPPPPKTGLDHLGAQAPCIYLYGQLLPGITNVTDRARYYSFYPWFFWAVDQRYKSKTWDVVVEYFRRGDCLFTLVAERHARQTDRNDSRHGIAMVGREKLVPALSILESGTPLRLSDFSTRDDSSSTRYFKNKLGGLGQYYMGVLQDLGILEGGSRAGVQYTIERAMALAETMDAGVNRSLFFEAIETDEITLDLLDSLSDFCPCRLTENGPEQSALHDLFFDRMSIHGHDGLRRRSSLSLLLHLIRELETVIDRGQTILDQFLFRGCVYSGSLPDERPWFLPSSLGQTREGWGIYQRNELLSLALQAIFWVSLRVLPMAERSVASTEDFVRWFSASHYVREALDGRHHQRFSDSVEETGRSVPPLSAWNDPMHEIGLGRGILELYARRDRQDPYADMLKAAIKIVLILAARDNHVEKPYGYLDLPADYYTYYPINLKSLRHLANGLWQHFSLEGLIGWLAGQWCIETHFRVALRKMYRDKRDTFQVRPSDQGLKVVNEPEPTYSSPRFRQAIQILRDIGAIENGATEGSFVLAEQGHRLLGEAIGE